MSAPAEGVTFMQLVQGRTEGAALSTDKRSVRTRHALGMALAREIDATGDLSQVTVTAVTERAGVTRRTFYSHFRDIPDLVCQTEDEILDGLRAPLAKLTEVHLDDLRMAVERHEPCPGSEDLLASVERRGAYVRPLLGSGGDPAFAERLKRVVREVALDRALDGIDLRAIGPFFDYYLTYAISAEVGVLVRWLDGGMRESVRDMARIMTALMFVRPGDLYDNPIDLDIPSFVLEVMFPEEDRND